MKDPFRQQGKDKVIANFSGHETFTTREVSVLLCCKRQVAHKIMQRMLHDNEVAVVERKYGGRLHGQIIYTIKNKSNPFASEAPPPAPLTAMDRFWHKKVVA